MENKESENSIDSTPEEVDNSIIHEQESTHEISYMDLIKMYYYEAKEHDNPFYRKHFEKVMEKLKDDLIVYINGYLEDHKTEAPIETKEGALYGYFEDFGAYLEKEDDPKKLAQRINAFIMYIHERLRLSLGEELLRFNARDLEGLNYMDPDKPLEEQEKIIYNKMQEEDEKYADSENR